MKNLRYAGYVAMFAIAMFSCSKDDDDETNPNVEPTPSAVASYDNSSAGIYKGAFIGSSGTYKISIKNGNDSIFCKLVFDGTTVNLTSTSFANYRVGQAISNALFTGTLNGQTIYLYFSCSETGTNESVSITYPGHTIHELVIKETSDVQVKCYEGTYTDSGEGETESGTWVIICNETYFEGYRYSSDGGSYYMSGTITGNKLYLASDITLSIDDNFISGSFTDEGWTTTISGKRTL
jgi:hypothetical protein